jgi:hypothetical protein
MAVGMLRAENTPAAFAAAQYLRLPSLSPLFFPKGGEKRKGTLARCSKVKVIGSGKWFVGHRRKIEKKSAGDKRSDGGADSGMAVFGRYLHVDGLLVTWYQVTNMGWVTQVLYSANIFDVLTYGCLQNYGPIADQNH